MGRHVGGGKLIGRHVRALVVDWLPAIATMSVIYWLSSQSALPSPPDRALDFVLKKLAHVLAYAALALFYLRGVRRYPRTYLVAFLLTVAFALSDEIHQSTVPRREPAIRDVAIDATGAGAALLWARHILERASSPARRWLEMITGDAEGEGSGDSREHPGR